MDLTFLNFLEVLGYYLFVISINFYKIIEKLNKQKSKKILPMLKTAILKSIANAQNILESNQPRHHIHSIP